MDLAMIIIIIISMIIFLKILFHVTHDVTKLVGTTIVSFLIVAALIALVVLV